MRLPVKDRFIIPVVLLCLILSGAVSCKKDSLNTDPSAKIELSQDSLLFDTVFSTIGSATKNIRIRNKNSQRIKISSINLEGGSASQFIVNVDGVPGTSFKDIELAAKDSMYIFIQVNVNPTNQNSPLIINDRLVFSVNGNIQYLNLEAWGQDAYYHRPTNAIKFKDGSYLPYSRISENDNAVVTWIKDKPHVIYGYLAVDSTQKLIINAGVRVYFNYKAGLWVYRYGELQVKGQKGNEVIFQGARREKDYADEPGQWDRIWINEGSNNNSIDYAIIKNAYVGLQAEVFGNTIGLPGRLKLTNTKIQNMSLWGLYALAYNIYGGNNVISNCQEHSLNILLGGKYTFLHCSFSNFWSKDKSRDKSTVNISNYTESQVLPMDSCYFGNCIIDGTLDNELVLDVKSSGTTVPHYTFSSCWIRSNSDLSDASLYPDVRKGSSALEYKDIGAYDFETKDDEARIKGFNSSRAVGDAGKFPFDINQKSRSASISNGSISAGAFDK
ncbi:MAG TPA: hypothetical protein PLQ93_08810 [Bacteroidia bacterium]|nr:hypothetical protein [Bacteroidia bacterium]